MNERTIDVNVDKALIVDVDFRIKLCVVKNDENKQTSKAALKR
jgi:hypothetical protein